MSGDVKYSVYGRKRRYVRKTKTYKLGISNEDMTKEDEANLITIVDFNSLISKANLS